MSALKDVCWGEILRLLSVWSKVNFIEMMEGMTKEEKNKEDNKGFTPLDLATYVAIYDSQKESK